MESDFERVVRRRLTRRRDKIDTPAEVEHVIFSQMEDIHFRLMQGTAVPAFHSVLPLVLDTRRKHVLDVRKRFAGDGEEMSVTHLMFEMIPFRHDE